VQEFVPLVSGFALGLVVGAVRPSIRPWLGGMAAVVLGTLATVVTGEVEISWAFVLLDIPLVALAALCGLLVARRHTSRTSGIGWP
jgi:hypothetical protein